MRVRALEKGARGVVKIGLDSGSLFLFRLAYLSGAEGGEGEEAGSLALLENSFATGDDLPEPGSALLLERLERARDLYAAEKAALSMLARREHSREELLKKLGKKSIPAADARIVLDRLSSEGLLSDERFAEAWIRSRLRSHPEGESSLRASLRSKGVEKAVIADTLGAEREGVLEGLERLARKSYAAELRRAERKKEEAPAEADILKRCYAKLRARGFSHADTKKALAKASGKSPDIDEANEST